MSAPLSTESGFVWVPSEELKRASRLGAFLGRHGLKSCDALRVRAAYDPEWFWDAVIRYIDLRFDTPYERALDLSVGIAWPKWCVGGRTNLVLTCLDAHMATAIARPRRTGTRPSVA